MPLPANWNRYAELVGNEHGEPLGALQEDRAEDRAGHRAEPADHHHRERAEALDGREDLLPERLLVQREQPAGERREEPGRARTRAASPRSGSGGTPARCVRSSRVATRSRAMRDRWSPRTARSTSDERRGRTRSRARVSLSIDDVTRTVSEIG